MRIFTIYLNSTTGKVKIAMFCGTILKLYLIPELARVTNLDNISSFIRSGLHDVRACVRNAGLYTPYAVRPNSTKGLFIYIYRAILITSESSPNTLYL